MPALVRLALATGTLVGFWFALFMWTGVHSAPALATPDARASPAGPTTTAASAAPSGETAPATDLDGAALDALLVQSREAFVAEQWSEALVPTRALVDRFPGQHVYLARLAEIYNKLGRTADEAAAWELFMDRSPLPGEACPQIGHAYRKLGHHDRAVEAFERCFAADTSNAELAFFVGLGNEWATRFDVARSFYDRAIAMSPPHYDSEVGLARLDLHGNKLAEARVRAQAVLAHVPTHVDAELVAGLAEQRAGHRREARVHLERAVKLSPDYFDVQLALGVLDYSESRYQAARRHFEAAAALDAARGPEVQPWLDRTETVKASR